MADTVRPPDSDAYKAAGHAQKVASNPDHSAWVVANAGSGKTKVLIDRVARLLLKKADPDSILCVTYTKAAANEMLERLFKTLGEWSIMEASRLRAKLGDLEARPAESYTDDELTAARALFARALETPGGLRIETIHAFCGRILRRFPLEAGVPPGFSEIEEDDTDEIWRIATQSALLSGREGQGDIGQLSAEAGFGGALKAFGLLRSVKQAAVDFAASAGGDPEQLAHQIQKAVGAPDQSAETLIARAMHTDFPIDRLRRMIPLLEDGSKRDQETALRLRRALEADSWDERWAHYQSIFLTASGAWRESNPYTNK
ncbi:MAG: UvrD-helicase domain-containing protein, partial [Pseudomonadota bacterium]